MATYTFVNIKLPEAKRLEDLYSIAYDLDACSKNCDYYLETSNKLSQPDGNQHYLECFSVNVFIKYGRCFVRGARTDTQIELSKVVPEGYRELHELFLDVRDKYIAHSINDFEDHNVRVWLNPEERGKKINNVNIGSVYLSGPELIHFIKLKELITHLLKWVDAEKKKEQNILREVVNERFDIDDLYQMEAGTMRDIDYSKVRKRRKNP